MLLTQWAITFLGGALSNFLLFFSFASFSMFEMLCGEGGMVLNDLDRLYRCTRFCNDTEYRLKSNSIIAEAHHFQKLLSSNKCLTPSPLKGKTLSAILSQHVYKSRHRLFHKESYDHLFLLWKSPLVLCQKEISVLQLLRGFIVIYFDFSL